MARIKITNIPNYFTCPFHDHAAILLFQFPHQIIRKQYAGNIHAWDKKENFGNP